MRHSLVTTAVAVPLFLAATAAGQYEAKKIIDAAGDGFGGNPLDRPRAIALDASSNAYIAGGNSDNAFRVRPSGSVAALITETGDGQGNTLNSSYGMAVWQDGQTARMFVSGSGSNNAFVNPGNDEVIDDMGGALDAPFGIAVDDNGTLYVTGFASDNVFSVTEGGVITEIIDSTGDGGGNPLDGPTAVAVATNGNVYVAGSGSDNAFMIEPGGAITEIIDATGDGAAPLDRPFGIAVGDNGNVYITGSTSDNAFEITPGGVITEIITAAGDGMGNPLDRPFGVAVGLDDTVYIAGSNSDNAFSVSTGGVVTEIVDAAGDGTFPLEGTEGVAVNEFHTVFVTGSASNNGFRLDLARACCLDDGSCDIIFPGDCEDMGGIDQGEGAICDFECPQPGACCLADGSCVFSVESDCDDLDGEFAGEAVSCEDADCPQPGACCDDGSGTCVDGLFIEDCEAIARRWGGPLSTCEDIDPVCETAPAANLIISEVVDGTLPSIGYPKFVEITNCDTVDVDVSVYNIGLYNGGNPLLRASRGYTMSGVLAPGDTYVLSFENSTNRSCDPDVTCFEFVYGFVPDQSQGPFINGDDTLALFLGQATGDGSDAILIDVYGVPGGDGTGEVWEYLDGYSNRLPGSSASAVFDAKQWDIGGVDSLEGGIGVIQANTDAGSHDCGEIASCDEDLDGDTMVGFSDLLLVLASWGPYDPCPPFAAEDLDENCDVGFSDLLMILAAWGPCD